jgi:hypothetical protein
VESFFLRANHPFEPRALWLKATVLVPDSGEAIAEAWCASFGPAGCSALKQTIPLADAIFAGGGSVGTPVHIEIGGCTWDLTPDGGAVRGELGDTRWDLAFTAASGIGRPMWPYPSRRMVTGPLPRLKLITPLPVLSFAGAVDGTPIASWTGSQGHNWGRAHGREYAWGQVVFPEAGGSPTVFAEGFTGSVRIAGITTPLLSSLVVRRGDREYRFDQVFKPWRQRARIAGTRGDVRERRWDLAVSGKDGRASIAIEVDEARMVCLGYRDPSGELAFCLNSKLARARLAVEPTDGEPFTCETEHGAALELLRRTPDPAFPAHV